MSYTKRNEYIAIGGQLQWHADGWVRINTPKTQGYIGFAGRKAVELTDCTMNVATPFGGGAFSNPRLFTPWVDPVSGVRSYILTARVAPLQSSFYFVNPSFTETGCYCWFYCAYPPEGNANHGRSLGVIDLTRQELRHFPETLFLDASPMVNLQNGEAYWCTGAEIWKRGPEMGDARAAYKLPAGDHGPQAPARRDGSADSLDGRSIGCDHA